MWINKKTLLRFNEQLHIIVSYASHNTKLLHDIMIKCVIWTMYSHLQWHYRKPAICRVPEALPSVFYRALGKDRVSECQIKYTRQTKTHGKIRLCRVFFSGTRQKGFLPCAFFWPSANQFFEAIFEALNEFKWKTFQLQSCITSQDLQSLYWSFLHLTKRQ